MPITIESSRFGRVEIDPTTVIEFPEGLLGLGGSRYTLLARDAGTPFMWLQSLDDASLALPITNPHLFFAGYELKLTDDDVDRLGLDGQTAVDVYVTVKAGASLDDFTANQRAPILVWGGQGYQIINQAPGCELRAPLFAGVEVAPVSGDGA